MTRYLAYSSVLHGLAFGTLLLFLSWTDRPQAYYGFQFLGGQSGFGTGRLEPAPAPAPTKEVGHLPGSAAKEETLPKSDDTDRVAIAKKTASKKETAPTAKSPEKNPKNKAGEKGGRGNAALGHGDFQGSKTGPVGGVGTSLEIGGFGPGGAGGAGNLFPYKWYGELVYKKLWEAWDRTDAGTLECKVAFKILKDGKVLNVKIKSTSGDALFDMNAKRAVLVAAPFPKLPDGFKEEELPILVRFRLQ
ncbi:MAG: cell envelope integrity protein TolA [Elusimicrobia bacterium]|nr:cell envelope integrity protein TolA [Elusimicrobiota bacterium]